jgi:site-specific DNA-cytosine methylase
VPVAQVFKVRGVVEREDGSRGSTNIGKQAGKGYLGSEERAFTLAAAQDQFVAQPIGFGAQMSKPKTDIDLMQTLQAKNPMAVAFHENQRGELTVNDTTGALKVGGGKPGQGYPAVAVAQPIPIHDQATRHAGKRGNNQDGKGNGLGIGQPGDPAPTLTKGDKHAVAQPVAYGIDGEQNASEELIGTLRSHQSGGYEGARVAQPVATVMQVRRLTPVECERLQGFPDNYTNIPWRKKDEAPDGPRYKALGNSMAVPCMRWIGERIAEVDRGD